MIEHYGVENQLTQEAIQFLEIYEWDINNIKCKCHSNITHTIASILEWLAYDKMNGF